jgi:chloride channel protein, CIC family
LGFALILALVGLRLISTPSTVAGGGVGGVFFPVVAVGAAIGAAVGVPIPGPTSLYAVVGIAALLGSAYKVPLAGVAFVAEATGAPGYVIPGLLAAAIAYLLSGDGSLSHRQRSGRTG